MATQTDLQTITQGINAAKKLARRDLQTIFYALPFNTNPADTRDALIEALRGLNVVYGDIAASAAAEWYEELRMKSIGGHYTAILGETLGLDDIEQKVRYQAAHLFTDNPEKTLNGLTTELGAIIGNTARNTITENAIRDPKRVTFARVPSGAKTCAWCTMLASRGYVYATRETAGELNKFHTGCDCQIMPSWSEKDRGIKGYDPRALEEIYMQARIETRRAGKIPTTQNVLSTMRRTNPGAFTDSHLIS